MRMTKGIIYKATNTFNGKVYIGQTIAGLAHRMQQHYKDARADDGNEFHNALYQYPNGFKWDTIDTFCGSREYVMHKLNIAEEYHITKYNSTDPRFGYNATEGGYSSDKFADYIKRRMESIGGKGKAILQYDPNGNFVREFSSLNAVAAYLEKPKMHSKSLLSGLHYGYMWRVKTSNNFPKKIASYEMVVGKKPTIPILVYDTKGDFFGRYPSPEDASKATGIPRETLRDASKRKSVGSLKIPKHLTREFYFFREPDDGAYPRHIDIEVIMPKEYERKENPIDNRHAVLQYGLDGKFVARFPSVQEACDILCVAQQTVRTSMRRPLPYPCTRDGKFIFRDDNGSTDDIEVIPFIKKSPKEYTRKMEHRIIQYSKDGEFIKVWDNTLQAANAGTDTYNLILKTLKGEPTKKAMNYQWRYYEENYPMRIDVSQAPPKPNPQTRQRKVDLIAEIDWRGNILATYNGTREAAEKTGVSQSYICNVLKGKIRRPKRRFKRVKES